MSTETPTTDRIETDTTDADAEPETVTIATAARGRSPDVYHPGECYNPPDRTREVTLATARSMDLRLCENCANDEPTGPGTADRDYGDLVETLREEMDVQTNPEGRR